MSISLCDILKINEDELKYVLENIVGSSYNDLLYCLKLVSTEFENLKLILYTCGENGAYAYRKGEDILYFCPAKKVKVVSTVGAGDSFGAVFLTEYLKGKNIDTCLIKATERSGRVVACDEAVPLEM
jgi:sugar/nucleoside kinase (ribokinase family)